MCSTSMTSASSSRVIPRLACSCSSDADGVGDLAAPAVPDRDVDQDAVDVAGGLGGRLELLGRARRQQVERADGVAAASAAASASAPTASSMMPSSGSARPRAG